ncbi:MAG: membrane protein insertase YidC [Victivallaceae bacterium]|nr:membrane protein insertase YidC [Victivallaceae bacterium]
MKFNKDILTAIVISLVILLAWGPLSKFFDSGASAPVDRAAAAQAPSATSAVQPASATQTANNPAPVAVPLAAPAGEQVAAATISGAFETGVAEPAKINPERLSNAKIEVVFSAPDLAMIDEIVLKDYRTPDRDAAIVLDNNLSSRYTLIPKLQPGALSVCGAVPWREKSLINHGRDNLGESYTVERLIAAPTGEFKLAQTWTIGDGYIIACDIAFSGTAADPLPLGTVFVSGGDLDGVTGLAGSSLRGAAHRFDYSTAAGKFASKDVDDDDYNHDTAPMSWIGVSNKYFAAALGADRPFTPVFERVQYDAKDKRYLAGIAARLDNVTVPAAGAAPLSFHFNYFAGPKVADALTGLAPNADNMMHLSYRWLDPLANLMLNVLLWLHKFCGSYGWSIIILTLIVRLLLFPITRRANLSMKRMAAVQPKIKAIREEFKDRPELMNQKTMELYRTEKINPLGGCLPLLLQFPIFIALYAALSGAVQLRHVGFWWSPDLAGPDTVAHLFGLPVNPLVLSMTLLMVLQQHMTPTAMDPMQKKMMYLMPLVMLFFFYDLPSGLTLYWTVSQIFSILQMYLQRKWDNQPETPKNAGAKS